MLNQYPNENAITYKHLLVETLEDYFGDLCHDWLSPSYDLDKLLPQFVGHFVDREEKESHNNNVWIVKPWNLGTLNERLSFVDQDLMLNISAWY
jgi:hypothetical protein